MVRTIHILRLRRLVAYLVCFLALASVQCLRESPIEVGVSHNKFSITASDRAAFWGWVQTDRRYDDRSFLEIIDHLPHDSPDPEAQFITGYLGYYGIGSDVSRPDWQRDLGYSAAADYAPAEALLGYCYCTGQRLRSNAALGTTLLERAVSHDHPFAYVAAVAASDQESARFKLNPEKKKLYLTRAAAAGYLSAEVMLGQLLADAGDVEGALKIVRPLANKDQPVAQFVMGAWYINGTVLPQDTKEGFQLLERAVAASGRQRIGYFEFVLARLYEKGAGTQADTAKAIDLYEKAYRGGYAEAGFSLVNMYLDPTNPNKNASRAREILDELSDIGIPEAETRLGSLLMDGGILPADRRRALELLRDASSQGSDDAQQVLRQVPDSRSKLDESIIISHKSVAVDDFAEPAMVPIYRDGKRCFFMLDTGSGIDVLDTNTFPRLERTGRTVQFLCEGRIADESIYVAPQLKVGDFDIADVKEVAGADLTAVRSASRKPIVGILGMPSLRANVLQFDYGSKEIRIMKPDNYPHPDWGQSYDLLAESDVPEALLNIGDDAQLVRFDSGMEGDMAIPENQFAGFVGNRLRTCFTEQFVTGTMVNLKRVTRLPLLKLGAEQYENLLCSDSKDSTCILGMGFLDRNLVTFDFPHNRMYLKPSANQNYRTPHSTWGFTAKYVGDKFIVQTVDDEGPAVPAGLQTGDQILTINGQDIGRPDSAGLNHIGTLISGGSIRIDLLRSGNHITTTVQKKDI